MAPERGPDGLFPLPEGAMDLEDFFSMMRKGGLEPVGIVYPDGSSYGMDAESIERLKQEPLLVSEVTEQVAGSKGE